MKTDISCIKKKEKIIKEVNNMILNARLGSNKERLKRKMPLISYELIRLLNKRYPISFNIEMNNIANTALVGTILVDMSKTL